MELLTINIQSCSDLITNSSSELFQIQTDKSVEDVWEILVQNGLTDGMYQPFLFKYKDYCKNLEKYNDFIHNNYPENCSNTDIWSEYWTKYEKFMKENPKIYLAYIVNGWFFDYRDERYVLHLYQEYLENPRCPFFTHYQRFLDNKKVDAFYDNVIIKEFLEKCHDVPGINEVYDIAKEWELNVFDYGRVEDLDGQILILSTEDNSIPYDNINMIKELFNCKRCHLG